MVWTFGSPPKLVCQNPTLEMVVFRGGGAFERWLWHLKSGAPLSESNVLTWDRQTEKTRESLFVPSPWEQTVRKFHPGGGEFSPDTKSASTLGLGTFHLRTLRNQFLLLISHPACDASSPGHECAQMPSFLSELSCLASCVPLWGRNGDFLED